MNVSFYEEYDNTTFAYSIITLILCYIIIIVSLTVICTWIGQ